MPPEAAIVVEAGTTSPPVSRIVRRVHMYLGLFLVPWMFMYAASTVVMNHREFVQSLYATKAPAMVRERELDFSRAFATSAPREEIAKVILSDLGLEGAHRVSGGNGKPLVIDRQHAFAPRRITWDPNTRKIVIEKQEFRSATFLERMHRRRGYQHPYALEDTWAFSVDLAVVTMVFWSLSGLWLWWELRSTRFWGAVYGGLGMSMFVLFLVLL
jgi:hypothetical protein